MDVSVLIGMNEKAIHCDLCGATAHSITYDLRKYRILRCQTCGLIHRYPMPNDDELYEMYNVERHVSEEELDAYYQDFRKETYRKIFKQLEPIAQLPRGSVVFDVGAGKGWSHSIAQECGYRSLGMDLSIQDTIVANQIAPTFQARAEEIPLKAETVDVLLMIDVLEHVRDPRLVLQSVKRILKPGAYLVLRVPNVDGILTRSMDLAHQVSGRYFKRPGYILYSVHLYGFSIDTLTRYLQETGFEICVFYDEDKLNLSKLKHKAWGKNPLVRFGISIIALAGGRLGQRDELVVIARRKAESTY